MPLIKQLNSLKSKFNTIKNVSGNNSNVINKKKKNWFVFLTLTVAWFFIGVNTQRSVKQQRSSHQTHCAHRAGNSTHLFLGGFQMIQIEAESSLQRVKHRNVVAGQFDGH